MKRTIESKIEAWLKNDHKALLIEGARQVGKTYSIREILRKNGISFFEINFVEREDILHSLESIEDIDEFVEKIQLYSPKPLTKGESVIFFDEVQEFPEIATKIKFLVDEGSFRYVLSGSLLGIELKGIKSVPVGYLTSYRMYPMTFFEFVSALGVSEQRMNYLRECFEKKEAVDELIHRKLLSLFGTYLIVGGMPAVVAKFLETKNLYEVDKEQKDIINQYKADFTKYENLDKRLRIISIYENIPSQLNKQNMKFTFTYLDKELRFDRYENSFLWLKDAGVSLPVYDVSDVEPPLVVSKEKNNFKLFLSDVGLLTSCYPFSVREEIVSDANNSFNNGALFENFICQELTANDLKTYYFKNTKIGEIDFLTEIDDSIVALEVKSGKYYMRHISLDNLKKAKPDVLPIVLCKENVKQEDTLYLPIYMVGFLKNAVNEHSQINIDISGL